ncbi:kinesin-like protein KIN-4A [Camellia sinensis]|uniref:kinesin-like protein KIN-4A n=1 Tax=Camellia sinensis TaxID=4442 RepID=UPI00103688D2|nr:kinesin-like protein KIN-4A [Camellia sinensis]
MSNEMQNMRQQLEYLQAELNKELSRELHEYHSRRAVVEPRETDAEDGSCFVKRDGLKRGLQSMDASGYPMGEAMTGENYMEIDEAVAKEWEHALLRTTMGKEFNELNKRLEQKESEMKHFGGSNTEALSQHFEKRILKLEEEKKTVQQERDRLLAKIENLAAASNGQRQKMHKAYAQKLKSLETQILDLKKKQDCQLQLLKQKQRSDEAAKQLQDEIKTIKVQKVQLQHKIKHEAEQFRQWKASHEKELLQVLDVSHLSM